MPPVGSVTELSLPALGIDPGRTGARCSATDVPRASRAGEAAARHGGEPARRFRSSDRIRADRRTCVLPRAA